MKQNWQNFLSWGNLPILSSFASSIHYISTFLLYLLFQCISICSLAIYSVYFHYLCYCIFGADNCYCIFIFTIEHAKCFWLFVVFFSIQLHLSAMIYSAFLFFCIFSLVHQNAPCNLILLYFYSRCFISFSLNCAINTTNLCYEGHRQIRFKSGVIAKFSFLH